MLRKFVVAIVAVFFISVARAQTTAPTSQPVDTPAAAEARAAALKLWELIDAGDAGKAKEMADPAKPEIAPMIEQFVGFSAAKKHLQSAADAKFGPGKLRMSGLGTVDSKTISNRIKSRPITVNGNIATVQGNGAAMRKVSGEWKVAAIGDQRTTRMVQMLLPIATKVADETAGEVEAGKYKTAAEADGAINRKLQAAVQEKILGH